MEKIKRTKVVDVLARTDFGAIVNVRGWVRTHRSSKSVDFIALNDGSTIKNVQVVVDPSKFDADMLKQITTGACINVNGELVESQGAGQTVEVQCRELEVYGTCGGDYPMQKKGQSFEYMRQYAHLRLRTNTFGAVMRIRHNMAIAIHKYFHDHGFFYFHTPLITASDCEGAGQMFQVTTKNLYDLKKDKDGKIVYDDDFFGKQTSLTVSGQLEGELGATALGAIYTFGPTFRAENSNTPRHLAEFWMIEPEVAFIDLDGLMDLEEDFIKYCVQWALDNCKDDLEFLNKMIDKTLLERLRSVVEGSFVRLEYTEGIRILEEAVKAGQVRVPRIVGHGLGQRARALPRGAPLQEACHHDRLPEGHQGVLHEDQRRRPYSSGHRRALPSDRRNHRRQRPRGKLRQADGRNRGAQHPDEGHVVVSRHAQVRHMPPRRLRLRLRAPNPLRDGNAEHTRRDTVPTHAEKCGILIFYK